MVDDTKDIKWHAVSNLRDDEVHFDDDWLNDEVDHMLVAGKEAIADKNLFVEKPSQDVSEKSVDDAKNDGAAENVIPSVQNNTSSFVEKNIAITKDKSEAAYALENSNRVYAAQVFENASFVGQNLDGANFAGASLINADFKNVSLKGVDLSGADLSGADLSGADLSGANLSGAVLKGTKFNGACFNGIQLSEADLDGAFLLDLRIDEIGIEELQELVEFLAKNFPHKLNLSRINLKLLDLKKIDLRQLDLRGVDFTGVDFRGVNIIGLSLRDCIITPEQIAQALGRPPTLAEMQQFYAPRNKDKKKESRGIDWTDFFLNDGREIGVWDVSKSRGVSIDKIVDAGRKVFRRDVHKPKIKDEEILEQVKSAQKAKSDERKEKVIENIEKNKQAVLEARKERQKELMQEQKKENEQLRQKEPQNKESKKSYDLDPSLMHGRGSMER